ARRQNNVICVQSGEDQGSKDITKVKKIKDKDGNILSEEKEVKERWIEYFDRLLDSKVRVEKSLLGKLFIQFYFGL
ncbi:hypothetical protein ACOME3_009615, partial [Neoechinorhynchus agilis]